MEAKTFTRPIMARQQSFEVGFPRYKVLLFNSSTTTATASVFAYRVR